MKLYTVATTTIAVLSTLTPQVSGACVRWWEGRAPFCNSNCPATKDGRLCHGTGQFSNSGTQTASSCFCHIFTGALADSVLGDGGGCWSGQKQICECCDAVTPQQNECRPTQTNLRCMGIIQFCENVMFVGFPPKEVLCSRYACGACFGFGSSILGLQSGALNRTEL